MKRATTAVGRGVGDLSASHRLLPSLASFWTWVCFPLAQTRISFRGRITLLLHALSSSLIALCAWPLHACAFPPAQVADRVDTLEAELLSRAPAIGWPGFIQPWGEHLLVSDWQGDPNLHVLNRTTGELVVSFGRIGRGPGDFPGLLAGIHQPSHDTSSVWVYDARKLTRIARPGPIASDALTIDLTAIPLVSHAAWLDSTTILGVTRRPPETRFVFFDDVGTVTRTIPGFLLGHDGIPVSQRVRASADFSLCVHPRGIAFAVVYMDVATIQIYDRAAKHVVDAAVPYSFDAPFSQTGSGIQFVPEWIVYNSCWPSEQYLYALYSGDSYASATPGTLGGQEVHAFDWDSGRLVRKLHLSMRVFGFAVDEGSGWLYAGSLADAGIYRFRLVDVGREE